MSFVKHNILSNAPLRGCFGVPSEGLGAPYAWNALPRRGLGVTSVYISVIFRVLCHLSNITFYPMIMMIMIMLIPYSWGNGILLRRSAAARAARAQEGV